MHKLKLLKEFIFNPFLDRIIDVLITENKNEENISLVAFCELMKVFCYACPTKVKKDFMFRIYDKDGEGGVKITTLRQMFGRDLFLRSHWSEAEAAKGIPSQ